MAGALRIAPKLVYSIQEMGRRKLLTRKNRRQTLTDIAESFGLDLVYAFGSRAKDAHRFVVEDHERLPSTDSDLDIAVLAAATLDVERKVAAAASLEDLFGGPRVDLVELSRAPPFLALDAVCGELLYAVDGEKEARYQLYVMRRAADLLPFQREREKTVLGF